MHVGPYAIEGLLGQGGMGSVYRARGPSGEVVALKVLSVRATPRNEERFLRELRTLGQLSHPHVVEVYDAGSDGGAPYLAMRLVEGETLAARLEADGPLPAPAALEVARALASALAYAHRRGIVHRDVKPENVLLGHHGEIRLTDFGLARDEDEAPDERLTLSGAALGTPGYWAPEQARGERDALGPATDVYGLGATLYAMLTGRPPQVAESLAQAIALSAAPVAPPSTLRDDVPRWLERVCLRCLEFEPAARYPTAVELERALAPRGASAGRGVALALTLGALGLAGALWLSPASEAPARAASGVAAQRLAAGAYAEAEAAATVVLERRPDAAELLVVRGEARYLLKRLEEAEVDLRRALSLAPGHPRAEQLLGEVLAAQHRVEEAEPLLRRALQRDPERAETHIALGFVALLTNRLDEALEFADAGLARGPRERWPGHRLRGQVLARRGDYAAAHAEFERALEGAPEHMGVLLAGAATLNALERRADAEELLDRALRLDPREVLALELRARVRSLAGDTEGSLADLRALVALEPGAVERSKALALQLVEVRHLDEALAVLQAAKARAPDDADLLSMLGVVHGARGEHAAALSAFTLALELDPQSERALRNMAFAHTGLGQLELARDDLVRMLERYPESVSGRLALAQVQVELGEHEAAVQLVRETIPLEPRNVELYLQLGVALANLDDLPGALESYSAGLELAPRNLDLLARRASLLAELEDFAAALADCERILALDPQNLNARTTRGLSLTELGRPQEAVAVLEPVVAQAPQHSIAWACLGRALRLSGRGAQARRALDRALELDPRYAFARFNRAQLLRGLGAPREALADLEVLVRAGQATPAAQRERVLCLLFLGELERADAVLRAGLEALPGDPGLRGLRVQWLALSGHPEQALALADEILARSPRQVEALQFGCLAAVELEALERALELSERLAEVQPRSPKPQVLRGTILHGMGRLEEARAALDEALRRAPDDAPAYALRASVLAELGDFTGGLADCVRAQALDPGEPHAVLIEGEVHLARGDRDAAAACLARAEPLLRTPAQRERHRQLVQALAGGR